MKRRKEKKNIAVIFGGVGYEHDVSIAGAEFLLNNIDRERYEPYPVYITRSGEWRLLPRGAALRSVRDGYARGHKTYPVRLGKRRGLLLYTRVIPIYAAFPILHGDGGEDGTVQGALECAGIPYVGCDTPSSVISADKAYTKVMAERFGIPTVPWLTIRERAPLSPDTHAAQLAAEEKLGYPMFIKPENLGSSVGCGAVTSKDGFASVYETASRLGGGRVMIERMLDSPRELECAYFGADGFELFTNPGEIICGTGFYSYSEKYSGVSSSRAVTEAELTDAQLERILHYAEALTSGIGIRNIARLDFFLSGDDIYFNEINTMPGMTAASLYPKLLSSAGISAEQMISRLVEEAAARI